MDHMNMGTMTENEDGSFAYHVSEEELAAFKAELEATPAKDLPRLRRLLERNPPWASTRP
jgi:hypothetical protein